MDTATNLKVVHESETQRQHPRVRVPATVEFVAGGASRRYQLYDLSAGGFSFDSPTDRYQAGDRFQGELSFTADSVRFSIPVHFEVRHCTPGLQRIGCRFHDVDARLVAALRHVINGYLAGELVTVGNMVATLARNNFTSERGIGRSGLGRAERLRALGVTAVTLAIGVAAFVFCSVKLYGLLFVTHATAAKVAAEVYTLTMPRDGTFFNLVPDDGVLKKGQPVGSFETALLDVVNAEPGALRLQPGELAALLGQQVKGSITSPCDCRVQERYVMDTQFVGRNQPLIKLLPDGAKPYILARFRYEEIDQLKIGRTVYFRTNNQSRILKGHIKRLRTLPAAGTQVSAFSDLGGLNNSTTSTDVVVVIEPEQPLDASQVDEPADVRLDALGPFAAQF